MKRQGHKGLDVRWLASGIALAGLIGLQSVGSAGSLLPTAEAVPLNLAHPVDDLPAIKPLDEAVKAPKVEFVSEIVNRSVFLMNRGAGASESPTTNGGDRIDSSKEPPAIELIGTLLSQQADVALIAEGSDRTRRLQVGDTVRDWKIVRIRRDDLLLKQDDALAPINMR
jgi:hypothetical protein